MNVVSTTYESQEIGGADEGAAHSAFKQLRDSLSSSIIGLDDLKTALLVALLTNGHVLLEGLPGTAKTRSVRTLASLLKADFGRVQFTPDLLPSDITGAQILHEEDNRRQLVFEPGPLFNNIVLADEINRAPPKVQSALLEAMEERQVTVAGITHELPELFLVLATQNPIELEGTYALPEAQLDRFLVKVNTGHPKAEDEQEVLKLIRSEDTESPAVLPTIDQRLVFMARRLTRQVHVSDHAARYMVDIVQATRDRVTLFDKTEKWIQYGASMRGTLALERVAQVLAWLDGRDYIDADDIRAAVKPVLCHRLVLSYEALAEGATPELALDSILNRVAAV